MREALLHTYRVQILTMPDHATMLSRLGLLIQTVEHSGVDDAELADAVRSLVHAADRWDKGHAS